MAKVGAERTGAFIEKYELLRPVAHGGMGSVWAAKRHGPHGFEKFVAIKTVLPELANDARTRELFLDEARLASAIVHRNVAHVLDFVEHEGDLYIVMEWVEGVSLMWLYEHLDRRGARIPTGIALRILADVCAGLHAAHELTTDQGEPCFLVHRDVSPQNVIVAIEGAAKLIDFGLAKTRFRVAQNSTLGELRGRLAFMAPEQAQCGELDRRADVWSVGASLLYVLAGHGPYGPCELAEALRKLRTGTQPPPAPAFLHPSIVRVLSGCLALRREDRFPTAEHVGWAIEAAIEDMGVEASASDVASFLAEQAGDRIDLRRFETGRGLATTGRNPVIPRDLTLLRSGTQSSVKVPRQRSRRALAAGAIAGCLAVRAIAFALGSGAHAETTTTAAVAPAPLPLRDEETAPPATVVAPPAQVAITETPPLPLPAHEAHAHPKRRAAPHPGGSKTRSKHDGLGGSQR